MRVNEPSTPVAAADALRVGLLGPCHDEATIARVVADLARHLPAAQCHVFGNASARPAVAAQPAGTGR